MQVGQSAYLSSDACAIDPHQLPLHLKLRLSLFVQAQRGAWAERPAYSPDAFTDSNQHLYFLKTQNQPLPVCAGSREQAVQHPMPVMTVPNTCTC